ncbi:MAG: hypothetical protein IJC51_01105 [Eggerthellaceae bacterium]|nr:hypothetical protein [Eggerthellaceae bacterium]
MKLASVILDIPTQALDAPYTYVVPEAREAADALFSEENVGLHRGDVAA